MYISLLSVCSLAALAVAQSTTYSSSATSSACGAQPVLDACIASTTAIIGGCATNDYGCLCQKYNDLLTCFNVCPNDARQSAALTSKQTYCNDASAYPSSTSSAVSRAVSSAASAATTTGSSVAAATGSSGDVRVASSTTGGSSASASASSTAKSGGRKDLIVGAGGVLMGLAGLFGAFL